MLAIIESGSPMEAAAELIQNSFEQYAGLPVLFLSAGGSALSVLAHLPVPSNASGLTLSVTDERYTEEVDGRNFPALLNSSFGKGATVAGAEMIDPYTMPMSRTDAALMWELMLIKWRERNPEGAVVALLGIGSDGHIAGIFGNTFPAEEFRERFEGTGWITDYTVPDKAGAHATSGYPERLSITLSFLTQGIDAAVVYAVGEGKCAMLHEVVWGNPARATTPAAIIHDMPQVTLVTDCKLSKE